MKVKKIKLNKTTIANLNSLTLKGVKGGATDSRPQICRTINLRVCNTDNTWCDCNLSNYTDCECNTINATRCETNCATCPDYC